MRRSLQDASCQTDASDERPSKRACAACGCACAGAEGSASAAAAPSPFDGVPDGVLGKIVSLLGFRAGWAARSVCRRWRQAAEDTAWPLVDVATDQPDDLFMLADAVSGGAVKLAPGAALELSFHPPDYEVPVTTARSALSATISLVAACSRSSNGLRSVDVSFEPYCTTADHEAFALAIESCVPGTLVALRPAPDAPSKLEDLKVTVSSGRTDHSDLHSCKWQPPVDSLSLILSPFSSLRSLSLVPWNWAMPGPTAAAVAAMCPQLRRVAIRPTEAASLAALAPLEHLEELSIVAGYSWTDAFLEGLRAVAAGPAGQCLRSIVVEDSRASNLPAPANFSYTASPDLVLALAGMPNLETVFHLRFDVSTRADASDVAALLRAPRLRAACLSLRPSFDEAASAHTSRYLQSLIDVLRAAPDASAEKLQLDIEFALAPPPALLVAFVSAARNCLVRLSFNLNTSDPSRALSMEEAQALLQCGPQLASLRITCNAESVYDVVPLQALLRLPAGVRLSLFVMAYTDGLAEICRSSSLLGGATRPNSTVAVVDWSA